MPQKQIVITEIVMAKVAVVMGSKSDLGVVKPAVTVLKSFGAEVEVRVISAHRTRSEERRVGKECP